jgi:hypothetical protein
MSLNSNNSKKGQQQSTVNKVVSKSLLELDSLTSESIDMYKMLAKRSPFVFKMFKNPDGKTGDESVCALPLLFFWIRKPPNTIYSKTTNTKSISVLVQDLTSIDIKKMSRRDIEYLMKDKMINTLSDQACSPIPIEIQVPTQRPLPPSSPASHKSKSTRNSLVNNSLINLNDNVSNSLANNNPQEIDDLKDTYE